MESKPGERQLPEPGTVLYDRERESIGIYQSASGPYVLLRPVGGGCEWEAARGNVRLATPGERLSAGVRAANEHGKWSPR